MVLWVVGRNLSSPTAGTTLWLSMWRGRPGHRPASQTTGCSVNAIGCISPGKLPLSLPSSHGRPSPSWDLIWLHARVPGGG